MIKSKPNILWYCTDQQRFDTIGAINNPHVMTPNIDRLVRGGGAFTRAYCQSPVCTPSRASFLTGCYPNTIRTPRNGNKCFANTHPLVTKVLRDSGYECGLIGKLHLASAYGKVEERVDDGYSFVQYSHAPRDDWSEGHHYAQWLGNKGESLRELTKKETGIPAALHQTTWASDCAIDFVRSRRDQKQPWLLSVNVYDPHPPFNPPKAYRDQFDPKRMPDPLFESSDLVKQRELETLDFQSRAKDPSDLDIADPILPRSFDDDASRFEPQPAHARDAKTLKAAYYAMIRLIDDQFGRILESLEEIGQRENTLVIFTSDHGEMLGDHGLIQKGCRFYEGLVRVPLIFNWPGTVHSGSLFDDLVELIDIAPTLLDFARVSIPDHMQGQSLGPLLRQDAVIPPRKGFVRSEYFDALKKENSSRGTMYRDDRYKLVVYHGHDFGELFDLVEDPSEFVNLWEYPSHQELKFRLLKDSFDASMLAVDLGPDRVGPI